MRDATARTLATLFALAPLIGVPGHVRGYTTTEEGGLKNGGGTSVKELCASPNGFPGLPNSSDFTSPDGYPEARQSMIDA